jgi:adenylate cyclase
MGHVGPVVAGMVGREKFGFDIWGHIVNLAGRLSKLGDQPAVFLSALGPSRVGRRIRNRAAGVDTAQG